MLCPNCNHDIPDKSVFCPECGCQLPSCTPAPESDSFLNDAPVYSSPDFSSSSQQPDQGQNPAFDSGYPSQNAEIASEGDPGRNGFSVASLVISLISTVFCCFGIMLPFQISSLIFGILGCKSQKKGMAIAGIVISVIGMLLALIAIVYIIVCLSAVTAFSPEIVEEFEKAFEEGMNYGMMY